MGRSPGRHRACPSMMWRFEVSSTAEVNMGCYSREFTLEVLREKPYFARLSGYLIDQLVELSCDDLARFRRALDRFDGSTGKGRTKSPGAFSRKGALAGYSHVHFARGDWLDTNFALSAGMPLAQPLDETVDKLAQRIVEGGCSPRQGVAAAIGEFATRIATGATGDWVIYKARPDGNFYLAIHEHTRRGSPEELALRNVLDRIVS